MILKRAMLWIWRRERKESFQLKTQPRTGQQCPPSILGKKHLIRLLLHPRIAIESTKAPRRVFDSGSG
jgi:hypothetical protein